MLAVALRNTHESAACGRAPAHTIHNTMTKLSVNYDIIR